MLFTQNKKQYFLSTPSVILQYPCLPNFHHHRLIRPGLTEISVRTRIIYKVEG